MKIPRDDWPDQRGNRNYHYFLRVHKIISRYRNSALYQWVYRNPKFSLAMVVLFGVAIILFLAGLLLTGIAGNP